MAYKLNVNKAAMNTCSKSRSCFTLVELLIVIAIISLIAAIMFPVFATAREKARQATCASNLRQLGTAFQQYSQDNDETMPSSAYVYIGWAGPIYCYVKSAGVFACPDDQTTPQPRAVGGVTYLLEPVSYAYNQNILWTPDGGMGIGGAVSQFTSPANTVLLYEVTARQFRSASNPCSYNVADLSTPREAGGAPNGTGNCVSPMGIGAWADDGPQYLQQATGYSGGAQQLPFFINQYFTGPDGRHSKGSNYLLCDGHAKWLMGDAVSTGGYFNGNPNEGAPSVCATAPTTPEDRCEVDIGYPVAAGTAAPGWTVTFSPV